MRFKQLNLWVLGFSLITFCFMPAGTALGNTGFLPEKKHCQVPAPETRTAKNLKNAAEYIRESKKLWANTSNRKKLVNKIEEAIKHRLPVNYAFPEKINFDAKGAYFEGNVSLLDIAVMLEQHDIVDLLLKHGASPDGCGTQQLDPWYLAIANNDFKLLNRLIVVGADPDKLIGNKDLQQTTLHHLAKLSSSCGTGYISRAVTESMHLLLEKGANVNARDVNGETPLTLSIRNCQNNPAYSLTTLMLLTHGADPFVYTSAIQPANSAPIAEDKKSENIFHKMVDHPHLSRDRNLWSLLAGYVWTGGSEMIDEVRMHPDLNDRLKKIQDGITHQHGWLGLVWSKITSTETLTGYLSEVHAIFNDERVMKHDQSKINSLVTCRESHHCFTPLHKAGQQFMTPPALEWLEWLGSDFSELSSAGNNVMHYSIKNNQNDNLHLLAPYHVNPLLRDDTGMTSFDIAMTYTPAADTHAVFAELCRQSGRQNHENTAEPEICTAFFDLFNAGCTQFMAPENITLSANPELQQRYLSSFALKSCQSRSRQQLSVAQKLQILTEKHETTHQRIETSDTVWIKPDHLVRDDMNDFPELKNYLIKQYPERATQLKHTIEPNHDLSLASLELQSLQSFAQLKHYLMYNNSPEKDFIQTYLIQRNDPALFMYTLTMGIKPATSRSECALPDYLSYLCQTPAKAIKAIDTSTLEGQRQSQIFTALLWLFGHYDFLNLPPQNQKKDLLLYYHVHTKNVPLILMQLNAGANPNAFITHEQYDQIKSQFPEDVREHLAPKPSCGLLADALHMEHNQPEAPVSKLLLLFGASVDPVLPHGCTSDSKGLSSRPLDWVGRVKDQELSELLHYFDPTEAQHRAWENKPADEWYTHQQAATNTLSKISELHSLLPGGEIQTPLCTCLQLQNPVKLPNSGPLCQQLLNLLPDSVQQSICSPAMFQ